MGAGIKVNLPTVTSFLLLYSLGFGAMVICFWTLIRAMFCFWFLVWSGMEVFSPHTPPLGGLFPSKPNPPNEGSYHIALFSYFVLVVTEAILILFTIELSIGLYFDAEHSVERYLICRFITWVTEVIFLAVLCLTHGGLIGWYLIFLMFVVLELYGFIVVFSYFKDMKNDIFKGQPGRISTGVPR